MANPFKSWFAHLAPNNETTMILNCVFNIFAASRVNIRETKSDIRTAQFYPSRIEYTIIRIKSCLIKIILSGIEKMYLIYLRVIQMEISME